jgi:hypothetical protein
VEREGGVGGWQWRMRRRLAVGVLAAGRVEKKEKEKLALYHIENPNPSNTILKTGSVSFRRLGILYPPIITAMNYL